VISAWDSSHAPTRPWRYGRWELELRDDEFAVIRYRGSPVLRAVRAVVRDRDWNTATLVIDELVEAGATVTVPVHSDGFGSSYSGTVSLAADGDALTVTLDLVSAAPFDTNRTGLVVLHPPGLAGRPLTVEHPDGSTERTQFPIAISPHQPASDIVGMSWDAGGLVAEVRFSGDVFEMEDQRNWTDASYKTYSRPLALPFPYTVGRGGRVRQTVRIGVRPTGAATATADTEQISLHRDGVFPAVALSASTAPDPAPVVATIGETLYVELDVGTPNWRAALARAAERDLPLDVRIVLPIDQDDPAPLPPVALSGLHDVAAALRGIPLARIGAFSGTLHTTTPQASSALRSVLAEVGIRAPIVGGTRAHFAELNRAQHLGPPTVDAIAFGSTPLFHALSTEQLLESVAVQRLTARQAVELASGVPVHIGPVTLRPRFNDAATTPQPAPQRSDLSEGYGTEFTGAVDARLAEGPFAAWTIASVAAFAVPGVASLTLGEEWGPRGIRSSTGEPYPVAGAVEALAPLGGADLLWGDSPDGLAWATGAVRQREVTVLAANLDCQDRTLRIASAEHPALVVRVTALGWTAIRSNR
jgi:hypothetical protein